MRSKPVYPRYDVATKEARNIAVALVRRVYPVNMLRLLGNFDIRVVTFREMAKCLDLSIETVRDKMAMSELGCLMAQGGKHVILYNDDISYSSAERIRFTLAHELGHYVLKHLHLSDKSTLSRGGMPTDELESYEREANRFAAELLSPLPVLQTIDPLCVDSVRQVFGVSREAATIALEKAQKNNPFLEINPLLDGAKITFKDADFTYRPKKSIVHQMWGSINNAWGVTLLPRNYLCPNCNNLHRGKTSQYCPICGSEGLKEISMKNYYYFYEMMGDDVMVYDEIPLDGHNIAMDCPVCENERLSEGQDICHICGTYIKNTCSGIHDDETSYFEYLPRARDLDGCGSNLGGSARYCMDCGCMSTFYVYNILSSWSKERDAKKAQELPF